MKGDHFEQKKFDLGEPFLAEKRFPGSWTTGANGPSSEAVKAPGAVRDELRVHDWTGSSFSGAFYTINNAACEIEQLLIVAAASTNTASGHKSIW